MGKRIVIEEGHYDSVNIDHRNGKETPRQDNIEIRPVIDGYKNVTIPDRARFKRDFVTVFSEDLNDLLKNGDLKFDDWRVLLWLIANLERNNMIIGTLDEIAEELKIHRTRVSSALMRLKKRNVVVEMKLNHAKGSGPRAAVWQVQIVNPYICYNGQTMKYTAEIVKYTRPTKADGITLLNTKAEEKRKKVAEQKRIAELKARAASDLFPGTYQIPPDPLSPENQPDVQ